MWCGNRLGVMDLDPACLFFEHFVGSKSLEYVEHVLGQNFRPLRWQTLGEHIFH